MYICIYMFTFKKDFTLTFFTDQNDALVCKSELFFFFFYIVPSLTNIQFVKYHIVFAHTQSHTQYRD